MRIDYFELSKTSVLRVTTYAYDDFPTGQAKVEVLEKPSPRTLLGIGRPEWV